MGDQETLLLIVIDLVAAFADYLGEDPDSSEAIEFLCLAEGGEVTHYEALAALSKKLNGKIKNTRRLSIAVNSVL